MPAIHDLPPETIGHIIEIAHPVDPKHWRERQARRYFYLDTSLVCRDWTPFAQRALWKFVYVDSSTAQQLVESGGAGRYPIESLTVDVYPYHAVVATLLASVRGVRVFKLHNCPVEGSWLCGDNWRDLKSLEFLSTYSHDSPLLFSSPFALTHLSIVFPLALPSDQMLVALGRQVSITSLELNLHSSMVGVFDKLSPLASRLVRLDLNVRNLSEVAAAAAVDPFFGRCTQLKHFASDPRRIPSIIHIPNPLESWTVNDCDSKAVLAILDVLNSKAAATSKLQRLTIQTHHFSNKLAAILEWQSWDGRRELEQVCRQRKIKLSVGWRSSEEVEVIVPGT